MKQGPLMSGGPPTSLRPGMLGRLAKFAVLVALVIGVIAVITGCGGVPGSAKAEGKAEGDGTATVRAGQVSLRYPGDWQPLSAAARPKGWDWAAQSATGEAGTVQLAVDGDYSALDVDLSTATLLAAAQVGGYPGFALRQQAPVDVSGARAAVRADFTYSVGTLDYEAVWIVARGGGPRTVVVQVSGRKPLLDELVATTIDGMEVR